MELHQAKEREDYRESTALRLEEKVRVCGFSARKVSEVKASKDV